MRATTLRTQRIGGALVREPTGQDLDIVVPCAYPVDMLEKTFPALGRAMDTAGVPRARATVVDEKPDRGVVELVDGLGFRRVVTGGIGNGPARNRGAGPGGRPWILFVDDDVELDDQAIANAFAIWGEIAAQGAVAVIGGLRAPESAPDWLRWSYEAASVNTASAAAGSAWLEPAAIAVTLLLIERDTLEAVGGFPEVQGWGWIDAMFGLAIEDQLGRDARVRREPSISGIHWYEPTWEEWLERQVRAGTRLAELERSLPAGWSKRLREITSLEGGARAAAKRALGYAPPATWPAPRSPRVAQVAAAAAFARGYREATQRG